MPNVIKDSTGKTICRLDSEKWEVEIVRKGTRTLIRFPAGRRAQVIRIK